MLALSNFEKGFQNVSTGAREGVNLQFQEGKL